MTTLQQIFDDARLNDTIPWAQNVQVVHPYTGEELEVRDYQITGLHEALASSNNRFGIYDTMGAGKSLVAYLYIAYHAGLGNKVLVVMPPKLLEQFKKNFYGCLKGIPVWMDTYYGNPEEREQQREKFKVDCPQVVCTSPEFFKQDWLKFHYWDFNVIVQDEAKWMSNPDTQMFEATDHFMGGLGSKAALIMNGTPANTDLVNLFGYIQFTAPGSYASLDHFKRRHVSYDKIYVKVKTKRGKYVNRTTYKINGYQRHDELYKNLFKHGRRVEVPPPTKTEQVFKEFSLSPEHMRMYRKLVEEKLIIFDDNTLIDVTTAGAMRTTCMQAIFDPSVLRLKEKGAVLETTREMVEECGGKVLLAAYHQSVVEKLVDEFKDMGAAALYGKTSHSAAEKIKNRFMTDPEMKVLVINYESGGVGVDGLQTVCSDMIAVEPVGIPGIHEQTVARLARQGQTRGVRVWSLIATGTLYRRVVSDRIKRKDHIDTVVRQAGKLTKAELRAELLGVEL